MTITNVLVHKVKTWVPKLTMVLTGVSERQAPSGAVYRIRARQPWQRAGDVLGAGVCVWSGLSRARQPWQRAGDVFGAGVCVCSGLSDECDTHVHPAFVSLAFCVLHSPTHPLSYSVHIYTHWYADHCAGRFLICYFWLHVKGRETLSSFWKIYSIKQIWFFLRLTS